MIKSWNHIIPFCKMIFELGTIEFVHFFIIGITISMLFLCYFDKL